MILHVFVGFVQLILMVDSVLSIELRLVGGDGDRDNAVMLLTYGKLDPYEFTTVRV